MGTYLTTNHLTSIFNKVKSLVFNTDNIADKAITESKLSDDLKSKITDNTSNTSSPIKKVFEVNDGDTIDLYNYYKENNNSFDGIYLKYQYNLFPIDGHTYVTGMHIFTTSHLYINNKIYHIYVYDDVVEIHSENISIKKFNLLPFMEGNAVNGQYDEIFNYVEANKDSLENIIFTISDDNSRVNLTINQYIVSNTGVKYILTNPYYFGNIAQMFAIYNNYTTESIILGESTENIDNKIETKVNELLEQKKIVTYDGTSN